MYVFSFWVCTGLAVKPRILTLQPRSLKVIYGQLRSTWGGECQPLHHIPVVQKQWNSEGQSWSRTANLFCLGTVTTFVWLQTRQAILSHKLQELMVLTSVLCQWLFKLHNNLICIPLILGTPYTWVTIVGYCYRGATHSYASSRTVYVLMTSEYANALSVIPFTCKKAVESKLALNCLPTVRKAQSLIFKPVWG